MRAVTSATILFLILTIFLAGAATVSGFEKKAYQMREDFGAEPLYDCVMQYYYYLPCPTYSWFWGIANEGPDTYGAFFTVGDVSTGNGQACNPYMCFHLEQFRVLDFAGYGTAYPGLFSVVFDLYCCDDLGCPIGSAFWRSRSYDTAYGWNYILLDPAMSLASCAVNIDPVLNSVRFLITATETGSDATYPAWGFDNVSDSYNAGCELHDMSSFPGLYPRPASSHYETMHSGYYGDDFEHCPPLWMCDAGDTSAACDEYGFLELAWRVYLVCAGPSGTEPCTWGSIKSMYR